MQKLISLLRKKDAAEKAFRQALIDFIAANQGDKGYIAFSDDNRPTWTGVVTDYEYTIYAIKADASINRISVWMADDDESVPNGLSFESLLQKGIGYWSDIDIDGWCCEQELLGALKLVVPTVVPEMVDLGLPSGLKWAKCNVGASRETDYGLYFKWGEAEGHTSSELNHFDTNYPAEFTDSATAAYGAGYRMPTKDEMQELIDGTDKEVAIINGVKGMKYMRKSDHNIYIFIPFAGGCDNNLFYGSGTYADIWSKTVRYYLYCDDDDDTCIYYNARYRGLSVRAVSAQQ